MARLVWSHGGLTIVQFVGSLLALFFCFTVVVMSVVSSTISVLDVLLHNNLNHGYYVHNLRPFTILKLNVSRSAM